MDKNLRQRIVSGIIMATLFLTLLLYSPGTAQALFIIIMLAMIYEYCGITLAGVSGAFSYVFLSIFGSIALVILGVYRYGDETIMTIVNSVSIAYLTVLIVLLFGSKRTGQHKFLVIQSLLYICLPIMVLLYWINGTKDYRWILMSVFIMIWISDVAAYFVGKQFGRRKLFEQISPKKTWAGFLGAGVFTCIAAAVAYFYVGKYTILEWISIGLIVWLFGSVGDLLESSLKRHYKIKDSGTLLVGHGGFLDRLDSFIVAIPFVLFYINFFLDAS